MTEYILGPYRFRSKSHAEKELRRILHAAEIGVALGGMDLALVEAAFEQHPGAVHQPVRGYCVGINAFNGVRTRGFQTMELDGTLTPWSYRSCLNPSRVNPVQERAMRAAIMAGQRQIKAHAYRGRAVIPCDICADGVLFVDADVHHLPPLRFRDIAGAWIGLWGGCELRRGVLGDDFAELEEKNRWVMFHDALARRAIVHRSCNAADER